MASIGGGGGLVQSYSEQDVRQAVELVITVTPERSNLDEALRQEEIERDAEAQLAEITSGKLSRISCVASLVLAPLASAGLSIFALGKFLTGHAFWTSQTLSQERGMPLEARLKKRFTAWGKDLYDGVVRYPVTAVIMEIAFFTGIIAPRLPRKFAAAIHAVALISKVQHIYEDSKVGDAVRVLRSATKNPSVIQQIKIIKEGDSMISVDDIVRRIFPAPPAQIVPPPSYSDSEA